MLTGASFAAGLNLYATVATLGLLSRWLDRPASITGCAAELGVIAVSPAMFGLEFAVDKVPAFDLIWNALHTFIRIPIAAYLAYVASSQMSPGGQLASALIASAAYGGKTALRAAITPSPEPFST